MKTTHAVQKAIRTTLFGSLAGIGLLLALLVLLQPRFSAAAPAPTDPDTQFTVALNLSLAGPLTQEVALAVQAPPGWGVAYAPRASIGRPQRDRLFDLIASVAQYGRGRGSQLRRRVSRQSSGRLTLAVAALTGTLFTAWGARSEEHTSELQSH